MLGATSKLTDLFSLPQGPRVLADFIGQRAPNYQALYRAVIDGRIPAERHDGRWWLRHEDMPEIARTFGLPVPSEAEPAEAA